jgi:hypothetical protein
MNTEQLAAITHTIEGYPVKALKWNPLDNILVGLVKDPMYGNPLLRDGFICVQWTKFGKPLKLNKGRKDLTLNLA